MEYSRVCSVIDCLEHFGTDKIEQFIATNNSTKLSISSFVQILQLNCFRFIYGSVPKQ